MDNKTTVHRLLSYKNLTTVLVCLLPIISIYRFLIPGINLGDFLLMLLCIPRLLNCIVYGDIFLKNKYPKYYFIGVTAFLVISITTRAVAIPYSSFIDQITRIIRIFFYCSALTLLFPVFDVKLGLKVVKLIAIVSSLAVIAQMFLYRFSGISFYFVFRNYVYSSGVYNAKYYSTILSTGFMRAGGFFLEPSHFCQYALLGLCFLIFEAKTIVKLLKAIIVASAIAIVGSGVGYVCLISILIIYFCSFFYERKTILNWIFLLVLLLFGFGIFSAISKIDYFEFVINRLSFTHDESSVVWNSRMGSYFTLFESSDFLVLCFGNGVGNTDGIRFYPSLAYVLHCCGIIGFTMLLVFVFLLFKNEIAHRSTMCFALLIVFFLLLTSTEIITNYWIIFYSVFVFQKGVKQFSILDKPYKVFRRTHFNSFSVVD